MELLTVNPINQCIIRRKLLVSGGARVLNQGGAIFFSRVPNFSLYGAPLWGASIGHLFHPYWGDKRALWCASAVRGALSDSLHQLQNKSGYQISVAG